MPGLTIQEKKRRGKRPAPDVETGAPRKHQQKKHRNFNELYEALAAFKKEYKHINVPSHYPKDPALGVWVGRIRMSQGTKLTPQQKAKLDQLGFEWETKKEKDEQRWNGMLGRLKNYRRNHLDCCVPRKWSSDPQLGRWVDAQRKKEVNNTLPPHRKQQLDAINFQWRQRTNTINDTSATDAKWLKKYQMLVKYFEEHGDCLVPGNGSKGPDAELAYWVSRQRQAYQNGKLKEERKIWLEELDFVYKVDKADPNSSRTQKQWDAMFQHLEEFKEANGHVEVSYNYSKWGLGKWVENQRTAGRMGNLDQRRAVRLKEIGITWGESLDEEGKWEDGFAMMVKYQKLYGHCCVSRHDGSDRGELEKESNPKLSKWVQHQMFLEATSVLLPERKERLDAIGFPFGSCAFYSDTEDDTSSSKSE